MFSSNAIISVYFIIPSEPILHVVILRQDHLRTASFAVGFFTTPGMVGFFDIDTQFILLIAT